MDGREWLATVFEPGLRSETLAHNLEDEFLRRQVQVLHDCGVLEEAETADALRRLQEAFEAAQRRAEPVVRRARRMSSGADLRAVLAPAGVMFEADALTMLLTSVELWTDSIHLTFAGLVTEELVRVEEEHQRAIDEWFRRRREEGETGRPPPSPSDRLHNVNLTLVDGLGTEYQLHSGSGGGGPRGDYRLTRSYRPGLPAAATRLELVINNGAGQAIDRFDLLPDA